MGVHLRASLRVTYGGLRNGHENANSTFHFFEYLRCTYGILTGAYGSAGFCMLQVADAILALTDHLRMLTGQL